MIDRCVLVTGFEPFAGEPTNPSFEIVRRLDGERIGSHRITGAVLPVAFGAAPPVLERLIDAHRPDLVLAIGQAGGRDSLSLERIAINLVDARIADNIGAQPIDVEVVHGAPSAYFATLPLKAMRAAMVAAGVPTTLSLSAGSFVCNEVFYTLCHLLATRNADMRAGFLHVPWLPAQAVAHAGQPSMALETMLTGVRIGLACALETSVDLREPGGSTH